MPDLSRTLKSAIKSLGNAYFWPKSKAAFLDAIQRCDPPTGANVLALMGAYNGSGWYRTVDALQVEWEFEQLVDWARQQAPARILEIGTASGATLLAWCRIATHTVVSVDLPGGIHGGGYPAQRQALYELFPSGRSTQLHLLRENSQIPRTRATVESLLRGEKLDILYIDGDHTLKGVTADYELWHGLVRPGGSVVFHDIAKHTRSTEVEVDVLWNRLKQNHPHAEFIRDPRQGWAGIGILQL